MESAPERPSSKDICAAISFGERSPAVRSGISPPWITARLMASFPSGVKGALQRCLPHEGRRELRPPPSGPEA